ncbi:hypothetical protein XELAEV_18022916mg [Xenopus laevis]|uniref:Uncharacterized protein n=1 Tax=Xenopus laevis TaxID=8355 RepID=A0A974D500_XENLA|nr:hypothetical protein XELAEV_18022916mg [Xenopus laevis]
MAIAFQFASNKSACTFQYWLHDCSLRGIFLCPTVATACSQLNVSSNYISTAARHRLVVLPAQGKFSFGQ